MVLQNRFELLYTLQYIGLHFPSIVYEFHGIDFGLFCDVNVWSQGFVFK